MLTKVLVICILPLRMTANGHKTADPSSIALSPFISMESEGHKTSGGCQPKAQRLLLALKFASLTFSSGKSCSKIDSSAGDSKGVLRVYALYKISLSAETPALQQCAAMSAIIQHRRGGTGVPGQLQHHCGRRLSDQQEIYTSSRAPFRERR